MITQEQRMKLEYLKKNLPKAEERLERLLRLRASSPAAKSFWTALKNELEHSVEVNKERRDLLVEYDGVRKSVDEDFYEIKGLGRQILGYQGTIDIVENVERRIERAEEDIRKAKAEMKQLQEEARTDARR